MTLLEIIVLAGLVGIAALQITTIVCGVRLWKSARKLTREEKPDGH